MAGVNKVILVGRLGRDPEVRYTPDGTAVANFSIATSEEWKDKNSGEKKERTEWHRIVAWRRLGEAEADLGAAEARLAELRAEEEYLRHSVGELDALVGELNGQALVQDAIEKG